MDDPMQGVEPSALLSRYRARLLAERNAAGHWTGELSASALSTATAVSALAAVLQDCQGAGPRGSAAGVDGVPDESSLREAMAAGLGYLRSQQNTDGGFGDTDRSHSNIATTYLAWAALRLVDQVAGQGTSGADPQSAQRAGQDAPQVLGESITAARAYVEGAGSWAGLRRRYGKDKTFVVPIMMNCAVAGLLPWPQVPALPFEAAVFPQSMYRFLRMPVVSYAVPALVAIGQARHRRAPSRFWPLRALREAAVARSLRVLERMQPDSGGYLEATPLTAFVVMALAATGRSGHPVAGAGLRFLIDSRRDDGSWPIDTNLATWVTSLAIGALTQADAAEMQEGRDEPASDGVGATRDGMESTRESAADRAGEVETKSRREPWCSERLVDWHLACQHRKRHPFTGAAPGGWGWSDLSGAVPDGDDTPAAVLALWSARRAFPAAQRRTRQIDEAIEAATGWLLDLQNRDGGWPTFCRGWGKLPFDRSSVDLTAHAMRALVAVRPQQQDATSRERRAIAIGFRFLRRRQREDGAWLPLWFGNQDLADEENPFYGTGRVLVAYADVAAAGGLPGPSEADDRAVAMALAYLIGTQNADGGWGGGPSLTRFLQRSGYTTETAAGAPIESSVEETAIVLEGLAAVRAFAGQRRGAAGQPHGKRADNVALSAAVAPSEDLPDGVGKGLFGPAHGSSDRVIMDGQIDRSIRRALGFLAEAETSGRCEEPWPIGFYFAKLWYHERLYPTIFSVAALARLHQTWQRTLQRPE